MRGLWIIVFMVLATVVAQAGVQLKSVNELGDQRLQFAYDAYQKNVFYIFYTPSYYDGFILSVHFPEELLISTHNDVRYIHDRRINYDAFVYHREGDRLIYEISQEDPIRYTCRFEAYPDGDTIHIAGWIQNRETNIDWHGSGLICLRFRENYDFYDLEGYRTFLTGRFTQERVSVFEASGADSPYFFLPTLDENSEYLPTVEKEDKYHHFNVQLDTTPANDVGGNRSVVMSCIHCDLRLDVPAGETLDFHTEVSLREILPNATGPWTLYE